VGFIQKLPTQLVAAFRATLEEINESDLLLHVVDVTHPNVREQVRTVEEVLTEIEADHLPLVVALNKVDLLREPINARQITQQYPRAVAVSALNGWGLDDLLDAIQTILGEQMSPLQVCIPYAESELVALFHKHGLITRETHESSGVRIVGRLPQAWVQRYEAYLAE
jgi:GTP-binding protein HflX